MIDLRADEARVFLEDPAAKLADERARTARATEMLFALRPQPRPSLTDRVLGDLRWVPALSMLVTMALFASITADAILAGETVAAVSRFVVGISLGTFCLLVHRTLRPS